MRYMNLACLLMTLVCLLTILLFSKTTTTPTTNQLDSQSQLLNNLNGKLGPTTTRRRLEGGGANEQDTGDDDDTRNPSSESIESIDRQPFVRLLSSYKRHSTNGGNGDDYETGDDLNKEENKNDDATEPTGASAAAAATNNDGFNLFDDKHDGDNGADSHLSSTSSSSFDDLLAGARRQLRRQQKIEREMEETTPVSATSSSPAPTVKGQQRLTAAGASIDPIIGQVFDDLDNFGLFKAIKSQLFNGGANFTQSKPIVRRSKNGATIIMSFTGNALAKPLNSSTSSSSNSSSPSAEAALSLFDKLLPPMLRPPVGPLGSLLSGETDDTQLSATNSSNPSGFATITIKAEPIVRGAIMSSTLLNPFAPSSLFPMSSSSSPPFPMIISKSSSPFSQLFGGPPPQLPSGGGHSSLVNPFFSTMSSPAKFGANGSGGGLLSMILRASSDLADQMQQLDVQQEFAANNPKAAANSSTIAANQSGNNSSLKAPSGQGDSLNSQASQLVGSKQTLASPGADNRKNETTGNSTANSSPKDQSLDDEVETFDVGQLISSQPTASRHHHHPFMRRPFGLSPMRSIYSSIKRPADSMIMISSSSSSPSSIFQAPDMLASSPFALPPLPPFMFPQSLDSSGPEISIAGGGPHMFMIGGSGASSRERLSPPPMGPMLRAMLGGIMSSLADKSTNTIASDNNDKEAALPSSSRASRRGDDSELTSSSSSSSSSNPGDEWEAHESSKSRAFNHNQMVPSADDDMDGQSNEGSEMPSPMMAFSTAPGVGSSLFEQMLESSSSSSSSSPSRGFGPLARVSGSIKQIFRGPGVTVERIIEMPSSSDSSTRIELGNGDVGSVQIVDKGVRSQSISRMDPDQATTDDRQHHKSEDDHLVRSMSLPSLPTTGSFIGRLFEDLTRHEQRRHDSDRQSDGPLNGLRGNQQQQHRQPRTFERSSFDGDSSQITGDGEQQDGGSGSSSRHNFQPSWSPKIRLSSSAARVRFSPRADSMVPSRFTMPAGPPTNQELSQLTSPSQINTRRSDSKNSDQTRLASSFTSPNSPLFGFPAMKPAPSATIHSAGITHRHHSDSDRAGSSEISSGQVVRSAHRPFVYHSNHEVAAGQQGRSSEQGAIGGGASGLPAAIGMGRRLDEDELIS